MANVPRLSKILRGKDTKPQTELEAAIKCAIDNAGGGGGSVTVDSELDADSTNPVQNKVIAAALANAVKMIHATAVLPETEGDDVTLNIVESDEQCRAMITSGKPVVLELLVPESGSTLPVYSGSTLPVYGLLSSWSVPTEGKFAALFNVTIGFNQTNIEVATVIMMSETDGKRGFVVNDKYYSVPRYSPANAGMVLSVNSNGELEWVTPT